MATSNPFAVLDSDDENVPEPKIREAKNTEQPSKAKDLAPAEEAPATRGKGKPRDKQDRERADRHDKGEVHAVRGAAGLEEKPVERAPGDRGVDREGRGGRRGGRRGGGESRGGGRGRRDGPPREQRDGPSRGDEQRHGGYDRRSGTGRGREVKKGGAGRHNWGDQNAPVPDIDGSEALEIAPSELALKAEGGAESNGEAQAAQLPGEGQTAPATEPETEVVPEPEPEETTFTFEEYESKRLEDVKNSELFAAKEERTVDASEFQGLVMASKAADEDEFMGGKQGKKKVAQRSTKTQKLSSEDIGFKHLPVERERTGGRGRRGEGRGDGFRDGPRRGRGEGRGEGRSEARGTEGRAEGRAEGRTESRFEGRGEGRFEGRGEGRLEGRGEGRFEGRRGGRGGGRNSDRPFSRGPRAASAASVDINSAADFPSL